MYLRTKVMTDGTNNSIVHKTHPDFENMTAVFVDAKADEGKTLSPDCAAEITVGDLSGVSRYLADYRYSLFWCRPFFGKDFKDVPAETQTILMEKTDGTYEILLATTGDKYKCTFLGDKWGLRARVYSAFEGLTECNTLAFVRGTGTNPYELLHRAYGFAVKMLGDKIKMREDRPYPEIFEYLGWCTCDAFYVKVSEDKILAKCEEFKQKDIPVKWTIIDDMYADIKEFDGKDWSTRAEMMKLIHTGRLYSYNASPVRFPSGLKHCIDEIKKYGMEVGVWHPATAYWKGANPDGEVMKEHPDVFIQRNGYYVPGTTQEQMEEFYDSFHKVIKEAGAHFLKIDNQSCYDTWYRGAAPVGEFASNMHKTLEKSVFEKFDGRLINCMCMSAENMWNRPRTAIARCSNDFLPENRDWFTNHITQCAYNCLTQGQLMWCDWDMWWTDDSQGIKNSVVRAVSGGPIYVSDTAKRSNAPVLKPLCLYDGRILRCDVPGVPTADCLTMNPEEATDAFKIFSNTGDTYYVAAFDINKDNKSAKVKVCLDDFFVQPKSDKYVVKEHFSGLRTLFCECCDYTYESVLKNQDDFRLYTLAPVVDGFAYLGLCEKFIGGITAENVTADGFTLREKGEFEFYSEKAVKKVTVDGKLAIVARNGNFYKVKVSAEKRAAEVKIEY